MVIASTSAGAICSEVNDVDPTLLKCLVLPRHVDPKTSNKQNVKSTLLLKLHSS